MKILLGNLLGSCFLAMAACDAEAVGGGDLEACSGVAEEPAATSSGVTMLAGGSPTGLTASASDLYWTSYDYDQVGPDSLMVWSAKSGDAPGSALLLQRYTYQSDDYFGFGNIARAGAVGAPYVYVVYNYVVHGEPGSQILQVPIAGGSATVLGESGYVGEGDLVTDGSTLFWSDSRSIYRLPVVAVAGEKGSPAILVQDASPVLGLDANYLYFTDGPRILRVGKQDGGAGEMVIAAPSPVTALYVDTPTGTVYWGEQGGAIRSQPAAGGPTTTYQESAAGRVATSVGFDGSRVLWADCLMPCRAACAVRMQENGVTTDVSSSIVNAGHLQWDAAGLYWCQADGLMAYDHAD